MTRNSSGRVGRQIRSQRYRKRRSLHKVKDLKPFDDESHFALRSTSKLGGMASQQGLSRAAKKLKRFIDNPDATGKSKTKVEKIRMKMRVGESVYQFKRRVMDNAYATMPTPKVETTQRARKNKERNRARKQRSKSVRHLPDADHDEPELLVREEIPFGERVDHIPDLRDCTGKLDRLAKKRADHETDEQKRVTRMYRAMKSGGVVKTNFSKIMADIDARVAAGEV